MASPLAIGTASAATPITSVSITSGANSNQAAGLASTATVVVGFTPSGSATAVDFTVTSGPDQSSPNLSGTVCPTAPAGTATCTISNTSGNPGTESVIIFADNDANGSFSSGDTSVTTTATFSGVPANASIVPLRNQATHTITTEANTCEVYKISAFDGGARPSAGRTFNLTLTETSSSIAASNVFTLYSIDPNTGACITPTAPSDAPGQSFVPLHTETAYGHVATGSDGTVKFGLASSVAGTGSVKAASANVGTVSDTDTITWGAGGSDVVANPLTVTPTSYTGYTGTTATFVVKATDSGGNPVQGVLVNEQETSGPGTTGPTSCANPSDQNGNVTCTITNAGSSGTQVETFWVDNSCGTTHTAGPDACEPQTTASAQFNAIPAFTTHTLTCVQELAGANQGTAQTSCTVPTSQHSIVFSETVKNSGAPVVGAIVSFSAVGTLGGAAASPTGTGTTDANGVATFTVNDPSALNGDGVVVSSQIGNTALDGPTIGSWATPVATSLAVTPAVTSVTKGGAVSEKVQITDQFGAGVAATNSISYVVSGRNNGRNGIVTTDSTGGATIAYTDAGTVSGSSSDTISVTDTTNPLTGSATINYLNGTTTATTVAVDTSGSGTSDALCNATGHTPATGVAFTHQTEVCAVVKNAASEVLAGQSVVFTVSNGQVAAHGALASGSTATYTATTDGNGVAFADVTSTKTGTQTVTATDTVTGTSTVTYAAPAANTARNVTVAPTTATVPAGTQQKFTFTVTDQYGNGVPGVTVLATQSGAGILAAGNNSVTTDSNGQASVQLTTQATDTGTGSVTGNITGGNVCGFAAGNPAGTTAGNCTAPATYTVTAPIKPTTLTVVAAPGGKVGHVELAAATVKNSDGTPAANQVVRYTISGANHASGAVVTNANGVALFGYTPAHAGTDTVSAYDDVNDDLVRQSTEPAGTVTAPINAVTEKPTIRLTTTRGVVTIHVTSHPSLAGARVTYYVKHHGNFTKIGTGRTGHAGHASKSFVENRGVRYTFRAKVSGKAGVRTGISKSKSITVKK